MLFYRLWIERAEDGHEWQRAGWYLFGFIPVYVYDVSVSGIFGFSPKQP